MPNKKGVAKTAHGSASASASPTASSSATLEMRPIAWVRPPPCACDTRMAVPVPSIVSVKLATESTLFERPTAAIATAPNAPTINWSITPNTS